MLDLNKCLMESVKGRIASRGADGKTQGWGAEDSLSAQLEVLEQFLEDEARVTLEDSARDRLANVFKAVINPSQFRQFLEKKEVGLLTANEGKKRGGSTFAGLIVSLAKDGVV